MSTELRVRRGPRRRQALWLVPLAIAAAVLLMAAVPVAAEPGRAEVHCVVQVVGETSGGELLTEPLGCYPSFVEAVAVASGGTVRLAPGISGEAAFTDPVVEGLLSTFTLGIHFDGYNGTGSSITVVGSSCTGGYWNTPTWFSNRISSSYNGCYRLIHYDYAYLGGASEHTVGARATHNLSVLNNRTESVQYLGW
jgi:hypothetical protein